jgi:hypothetical protein
MGDVDLRGSLRYKAHKLLDGRYREIRRGGFRLTHLGVVAFNLVMKGTAYEDWFAILVLTKQVINFWQFHKLFFENCSFL